MRLAHKAKAAVLVFWKVNRGRFGRWSFPGATSVPSPRIHTPSTGQERGRELCVSVSDWEASDTLGMGSSGSTEEEQHTQTREGEG